MDTFSFSSFFAAFGLSTFGLLTLIALALMFSAYVKIATVLSIVRFGLGVSSLPSSFVTGSLAVALTLFVMYPTLMRSAQSMDRVIAQAPAVTDQVRAQALDAGILQWRNFIKTHIHEEERLKFTRIAETLDAHAAAKAGAAPNVSAPAKNSGLGESWRVLAPAFIISELKEAFATGLSLLLPFLVIDLVISNILVAVGLDRINPAAVAFPCKLLLFVLADGWTLIANNLVSTYAT